MPIYRYTLALLVAVAMLPPSAIWAAARRGSEPRCYKQSQDPTRGLRRPRSKRLVIGFFGTADQKIPNHLLRKFGRAGARAAELGHVALSGACIGLPQAAILGAKSARGATAGISPYSSLREHGAAGAPIEGFDRLQFTKPPPSRRRLGQPNFMGRELALLTRADIAIIARGSSGTLGEIALAYEWKKPIGILTGTSGVTAAIAAVVRQMRKTKYTPVIYDKDPERLVDRLIKVNERWRQDPRSRGMHGDD